MPRLRLFLLAWVVAVMLGGVAEARFFSIEELEPGLRGTGKTVVRGTDVESFEVEFLGVLPNAGPSGDLILIRVSGDVIDRTGGIASGMSGSPVYIGDKLVGAIGYGYDFADHRIGLVTPIQDMVAVMDLIQAGGELAGAGGLGEWTGDRIQTAGSRPRLAVMAESPADAARLAAALPEDVRVMVPVQTPVLASGFSRRALERLGKRLAPLNLVPMQGAGGSMAVDDVSLEPGSALGVQLMTGDVTLTAIGTVTYVDGNRFAAFGHPFTNLGKVDYLTTGAYIHYVVPSVSLPFKLGSATAPVGSLLQDRGAAIAGEIGPLPYMVPVSVTVHDQDRGISRTTEFSIVNDERVLVDLAISGALSALDRSLDRLGPGTSRVVFQIRGEGMPRPLVRDNMWYSGFDVAAATLIEVLEAVDLVANNRFAPVTITRIQVVAEVEEGRWTARIEDAEPSATEVAPGESVRISVRVRPFRGEAFTEELILTVPEDASPGPVTVVVRGGGWEESSFEEDEEFEEDVQELLDENSQSLERLIEEFVRRERNNEIVAEFYSSRDTWLEDFAAGDETESVAETEGDGLPREESETEEAADDRWTGWGTEYEPPERVMVSQPTDYVILGSASFDLFILPSYGGDAGAPLGGQPEVTAAPASQSEESGETTEDAADEVPAEEDEALAEPESGPQDAGEGLGPEPGGAGSEPGVPGDEPGVESDAHPDGDGDVTEGEQDTGGDDWLQMP